MECWHDTERCVKSPQNPLGVPIWKIFSFCFWQIPVHPLGHHWTIAPENYATKDNTENVNTYVGYSVEPSCNSQAIIPHAERPRGGVYAMTKCVSYLAPQHLRAWPPSFYERAAHELGIHFTIGAINASDPQRCGGTDEHLELPQLSEYGGEEVMTNLGILERPVFMHEVAKSRVLLGVGRPWISPTPYQALCLGVPFINPIVEWDTSRPHDRAYWNTQHNGLRDLDPPYVYNVHKNDEAGFVKALSQAMKQPIGR
ncbi:hypothetical protein DL93DRAFT_2088326 [Clavulina sp. PMI_390]|nr:hypothetical protein DL93DRAFT_2088326 [Clavulina sp. PMI_390]